MEEENKASKEAINILTNKLEKVVEDLNDITIANNHKKENWIHKNCLNSYIPISVIQNKLTPVIDELEKDGFVGYSDELRDIVQEIFKV